MAFWRGFKSHANEIATSTRAELGLGAFDRLDVLRLAAHLAIPVATLTDLASDAPEVRHLIEVEREVFSAVTVFDGRRRMIVHNDGHAPSRQNSNLAHEISHGLLQHDPTPPLDDIGCRIWNQDIEDEAGYLAGCLLVPEPAALAIARGRWTPLGAARHFAVSTEMVEYRLNVTGARRRVARSKVRRR